MERNQQIIALQNREGFEEAFRLHYESLVAYAVGFLKEQEASEEVVQELFFNLWKKRDSLELTTSLKAYLYRATRNSCLNVLKHITIREDYKVHNEQQRNELEQEAGESVETKELQAKILEAVAQLPKERQKIFRMSRFEGLKYREIAEELNISVKTVENQMGKALRFLRLQLVDYLYILVLVQFLTQ